MPAKKAKHSSTETRADRVAGVLRSSADLFLRKNNDYGQAYIRSTEVMDLLVPDKSSLNKSKAHRVVYHNMTTIVTKLIRISNLLFKPETTRKVNDESVSVTWVDISVMGAMMTEFCSKLDAED